MRPPLLDRGLPGSGETERTTAHLSAVLDDRYAHLARIRGEGVARVLAGPAAGDLPPVSLETE